MLQASCLAVSEHRSTPRAVLSVARGAGGCGGLCWEKEPCLWAPGALAPCRCVVGEDAVLCGAGAL